MPLAITVKLSPAHRTSCTLLAVSCVLIEIAYSNQFTVYSFAFNIRMNVSYKIRAAPLA